MMRIGDVMTRRVVRLRPDHTVREALRAFALNGITGAPVVDERNRVIGILTEMDILRRLELGSIVVSPKAAAGDHSQAAPDDSMLEAPDHLCLVSLAEALKNIEGLKVSQLMTPGAITVHPGDRVEEKMALMIHRRIRRLPVVDSRGVLIGVISRKDLIRVLYSVALRRGRTRAVARNPRRRRGPRNPLKWVGGRRTRCATARRRGGG
ncbi:MAG: CBS domain-containing protein [Thermoplasmata archaeon]